jgi:hypothetical protein
MAHVVVDVCSWDLSSLGPVMIGEYLCGLGRKGLHLKLGYSGYVISAFAHNNCTGGLGQKRDIQQGMNHPPTSIHGANMNDASVYNIFGHDPEGRIACLAAYFYGPAWRPTTYTHLPRFQNFEMAPPRFGPPAPQQLVPPGFIPHPPPPYYGRPFPPYLMAPESFDPRVFEGLLLCRQPPPKQAG